METKIKKKAWVPTQEELEEHRKLKKEFTEKELRLINYIAKKASYNGSITREDDLFQDLCEYILDIRVWKHWVEYRKDRNYNRQYTICIRKAGVIIEKILEEKDSQYPTITPKVLNEYIINNLNKKTSDLYMHFHKHKYYEAVSYYYQNLGVVSQIRAGELKGNVTQKQMSRVVERVKKRAKSNIQIETVWSEESHISGRGALKELGYYEN